MGRWSRWCRVLGGICPFIGMALFACFLQPLDGQAVAQEDLPPMPSQLTVQDQNEAESAAEKDRCPTIVDQPLATLSFDSSPRDSKGSLISQDELPRGCWDQAHKGFSSVYLRGGGDWAGCGCHAMLQLARFCHPKAYFDDCAVERYGMHPSVPCVYATSRFLCDVALFPAKLLINKNHPCVKTPPPHCWSGACVCD